MQKNKYKKLLLLTTLLIVIVACKKNNPVVSELPSAFLATIEKAGIPPFVNLPSNQSFTKITTLIADGSKTYTPHDGEFGVYYWKSDVNRVDLYDSNNKKIGNYLYDELSKKEIWATADAKDSLIGKYERVFSISVGDLDFHLYELKNPPTATGIFRDIAYIQTVYRLDAPPPTKEESDKKVSKKIRSHKAFFFYEKN